MICQRRLTELFYLGRFCMRPLAPRLFIASIALGSVICLATIPSVVATDAAGTPDRSFAPSLVDLDGDLEVRDIVVQPDGKIVIGGYFSQVNGDAAVAVARLNVDGSTDTTFDSSGMLFTDGVEALALQPDGKIVIGGGGSAGTYVARINSDGSPDSTFMTNIGTGVNFGVQTVAIQPDQKILIGGYFTRFDGSTVNRIARLNPDGSLDTSFATNIGVGLNDSVWGIGLQSDGKIVIGGDFATLDGTTVNHIARLNADGTPDPTFTSNNSGTNSGRTGFVWGLGVQPDDKILVGGDFTTIDGQPTNRLARLNSDGSVDTDFRTNIGSGANSIVSSFAVQSDGKIVVGGYFTSMNGITVGKMARLHGDGTTDDSFINNLGAGFTVDQVFIVTLQANGGILAGGNFQLLDNGPPPVLARVFGDPIQSSGSANSAPLWLQSIGRESASTACPEGYSGSWALWPNGGTGGYVCNKSVPAYGN